MKRNISSTKSNTSTKASTKANAKQNGDKQLVGKLLAKSEKTEKAVKLVQPIFTHLTVGSKGASCSFIEHSPEECGKDIRHTWQRPANGETHASLNARHASGRPMPTGYACYDAGCFVGDNGGTVKHFPIADWRKAGLKKVSLTCQHRGEKITVVAYIVPNCGKGKWGETGAYAAVPSLPYGRLEFWGGCSDKRNTGFKASLISLKEVIK